MRGLLFEFLRYAVVGGIAFLADFGALVGAQELFFRHYAWGVYVSSVIGFVVGLSVNYFLSLIYVFTSQKDLSKGRNVWAFLIFGFVGVVGLGLTEVGMWLGVALMDCNYMAVKVFTTGVVLVWNYLGRKVFVFR